MAKKKSARRGGRSGGKQGGNRAGTKEKSTGQPPGTAKRSAAGECVVVGVGASAGGLDAYKRLLERLPDDSGMAFVLVLHLDPSQQSLMADLLSQHTSMPVLEVEGETPVRPNQIYVIPPDKFLRIEDGRLRLAEPITRRGIRLPIDDFFRSLAQACGERAIAVVLSGTGSDGAEGLRDIKAEGGITIVQQPENAQFDGMPRAAVATGAVDFVLPVDEMAEVAVSCGRHPYVQPGPPVALAEKSPEEFQAILGVLRAHTDQDFAHYKPGTLTRRIERRMGVRRITQPGEYVELLRRDAAEVRALFKDLLIGVTHFFREPAAWDALEGLLPKRIAARRRGEPFRVWVPGCSTGEEAYSIAMLLFEQRRRQNAQLEIQVFASDIDRDAVDVARLGLYPENVIKDVPEARIDAFFGREGGKLRVAKPLRESCVFAVQNILSDPPFSNLDLICCRNLLIYLKPEVQRQVFELFHFALKPGGLLFLGSAESPLKRKALFETLSQSARIFRKVGASKPGSGGVPLDGPRPPGAGRRAQTLTPRQAVPWGTVEFSKQALLEQFAPASVVVDSQGMIQYIPGPVRDYLDFPRGKPDLDLPAMAVDGLKARLRTALRRAQAGGEVVSERASRVRREGRSAPVNLRVQPLPRASGSEALYLVSFFDETASRVSPCTSAEEGDDDQAGVRSLAVSADGGDDALALQETRDDLQNTVEELESANEELKASNEEVMSMNEELHSTNEELQTSREELQSLNEELSTVNQQLHDKIDELESTSNDLSNLLASTDMATLFLDGDLRIRRFTPATVRLINVQESDVGRPIGDLSTRVEDPALEDDARQVLHDLAPVEKEVESSRGRFFIRRVTPFRTSDDRIRGVVVTFADVTNLRQAARRIEFRERQQAAVAQLGRTALAGSGLQSLFELAARELAATLNVDYTKVLRHDAKHQRLELMAGVGWQEGLVGQASVPTGRESQGGYTLHTAGPVIVRDLRTEKRFSGPQLLTDHGVVSGMSTVIGPDEAPWGVLGIHAAREIEFTDEDANFLVAVANVLWDAIRRRQNELLVRDRLAEIDSTYAATPTGLCLLDTELRYVRINSALAEINGPSVEEHLGKTLREVLPGLADMLEPIYRQVIETGEPVFDVEIRGCRPANPDVERCWLSSYSPLAIDGEVRGVNTSVVEITERMQAERSLVENRARLQRLIDSASVGIAFARRDGEILQANDAFLGIFSITREEFERQGWDWQNRVLPEDQHFADVIRRLGEDFSTEPLELRRKDANHDTLWVLASARPLTDDKSEYVAFLVDITAQKQAELALAESEERLRLAARMARFGTYYGDVEQNQLSWSSEFKQILGLKPDEPVPIGVGQVPSFVHQEDAPRVAENMRASLDPAGNGEFQDEHRIVRPDGAVRWIWMQGRTMFRGKGEKRRASRVAGVALDMTERHVFEEKLRESSRAAEASNEAKSLFLANMSHEIRTPITAILGYADVLDRRLHDPEHRKCVETIKQNGDHLCQILNDVLDLAKIESGKLRVRLEECDVLAQLSNLRSLMAVRAAEKGLALSIEFEGEIPRTIETDSKMLRQILLNLIGNAVKFSDKGSVRTVVGCPAERERLEIAVIDTGVGIAPEQLDKLFVPFEQADSSATRTTGGTGLGLSITKKLVSTLGGEISVESEPGQGSTFRVSLPTGSLANAEWVAPESPSPSLSADEPALPPRQLPSLTGRVLAVDDRREIRYLVEEFLSSAGAEVLTRTDGAQGVDAWVEQRDAGASFDAVVMDIQMPVMDGLEATNRLRAEGYHGPVIALTASALRSDREKCLEAGCNDFISKPIDRAELVQKIAHWVSHPPERTAAAPQDGLDILCVDDHEATGSMQKLLLEDEGHRVTLATGGAQSLEILQGFTPDAILLDLGLGDVSGGELMEKLRSMPQLLGCTFVCLTGRQESEVPWREMGFDHFLGKPVEVEEIQRVLALGKAD